MNGDLFGVFVTAEPSQTALIHLYFRNLDIHVCTSRHHTHIYLRAIDLHHPGT